MKSEIGREHLRQGQLGRKLPEEVKNKIKKQSSKRKCMNNGKRTTRVKLEDIDKFLVDGWKMGELPRGPKKIENLQYWVTDGKESKLVFKEDIQTYLDKGYERGRILNRDNKGKFISSETIENIS